MNNIDTLYIAKVNQVYDRGYELSRIAKGNADSFRKLSNFREYIITHADTISPFKSVSNDICHMIEGRNFDVEGISQKFDQINDVNYLVSHIKVNISENKVLINELTVLSIFSASNFNSL